MGFIDVAVLVVTVTGLAVFSIITNNMEWSITDGNLGTVAHSDYLDLPYFFSLRLLFGFIVWSTTTYTIINRDPLNVTVMTRDGQLKTVALRHFQRLTTFTVWCWVIQGVYFFLVSLASFSAILKSQPSYIPSTLRDIASPIHQITESILFNRTAWIIYEISFSMAFLVTTVVTFVLIPVGKKRNMPVDIFFRPLPLLFHNANVAFMVAECLLNRLPFSRWHFTFVVLYGLCYVYFSWFWFSLTGVFYYFFLDYERPYAIVAYLGLMIGVSMKLTNSAHTDS
jgi:hypothetical protein